MAVAAAATVSGTTVYGSAIATSTVGDNTVPLLVSQTNNIGPRKLRVENYTASPIYIAYDKAATLGSRLVPSQQVWYDDDASCVNLHVYTPVASSINGSTATGILVWGVI